MTQREQIVELLNKLYYYTDYQMWGNLKSEVFASHVHMDMTSLGAPFAQDLTAVQICEQWEEGFKDLDAVHHQAGNYIIEINGNLAKAKAYAIASHYKKNTLLGNTREFVGSYDIGLSYTGGAWKIDSFKFNLKYMRGNLELK